MTSPEVRSDAARLAALPLEDVMPAIYAMADGDRQVAVWKELGRTLGWDHPLVKHLWALECVDNLNTNVREEARIAARMAPQIEAERAARRAARQAAQQ